MKEQHKAMFIALRDGQFDHLLNESAAVAPAAPAPPAPTSQVTGIASKVPAPSKREFGAPKSAKDAPISLLKGRSIPLPVVPPPAPSRPGGGTSNALEALLNKASAPPPSPIPPPPPSRGARPTFDLDQASLAAPTDRRATPTAAVVRRVTPLGTPAGEAGLDLDLDALERAAAESETPFFQQIQDLPPPPAAVVGKKPPPAPPPLRRPAAPADAPPSGARPPSPAMAAAALQPGTPSAGRYAMSRPAAIFSSAKPAEGASIFGEDLISEKSLDEVILSYLAEDLDTPSEK
jgi:hypothetical protein